MRKMLSVGLFAFLSFSLSFNFLYAVTRFMRDNCKARLMLSGKEGGFKANAKRSLANMDFSFFYNVWEVIKSPQPFLDRSTNWKIIEQLDKEVSTAAFQKKDAIVYIPRSNKRFWECGLGDCGTLPFVVPAMMGLSVFRGGPAPNCAQAGYRGFAGYDLSRNTTLLDIQKNDSMCREVNGYGFSRILALNFDDNGEISKTVLQC